MGFIVGFSWLATLVPWMALARAEKQVTNIVQ